MANAYSVPDNILMVVKSKVVKQCTLLLNRKLVYKQCSTKTPSKKETVATTRKELRSFRQIANWNCYFIQHISEPATMWILR